MKKPNTPPNESERLNKLRSLEVLDTPPEERFDRVTRLACRLFDVPIALVSLVDADRQWFKSKVGLDADETHRDISFCGHAIEDACTLVVSDAAADPRFHDNPLVVGSPSIRFYAGRPLAADCGARMGTLCLIDRNPRELSSDEQGLLDDLAGMVEGELAAIRLATTDSLTSLSNRAGFVQLASKALAVCRRAEGDAAVVFVDMDGFKAINDIHGHAAGDRALVAMADLLRDTFRDSDVVGRLGGDEFCIFLSNSDEAGVSDALVRLYDNLRTWNEATEEPYALRCSTGVVSFDPRRHQDLDAMLAEADAAMYANKRQAQRIRLGA